ncbi:unnamed protein product [Lactuca saligna]|uniref:Uncharacterized protein n=1 Tax=Lactuca saligna TaxID=75948 RepID=A0AA35Z9R6_LACSI|nr:unnamed protein product [Lactuca saligna]
MNTTFWRRYKLGCFLPPNIPIPLKVKGSCKICNLMEIEKMENTTDDEKTTSLKASILSKYDEVFHAHTSDIKKVNEKITIDCEKFLQYYEDSCSQMEASSKSLQQQEYEITKK